MAQVISGYDKAGYGYADYPGREGYGISAIRPGWLFDYVAARSSLRIAYFGEAVWDCHHDLIAVQKTDITSQHVYV